MNEPKKNDSVMSIITAPGAFSEDECRRILELSRRLDSAEGTVKYGNEHLAKEVVRESEVRWIVPDDESQWLFEKLAGIANQMNATHFGFRLASLEAVQVAEYTGGGHYGWHFDIGAGDTSRRKLSISVQLSRSEDYEGGDLEFAGSGDGPEVAARGLGDMIVFPSFYLHRVTPVTSGVRKSLVCWVNGDPFS